MPVNFNSSHSPSHLVLSMDSSDNPDNPGLNPDQFPSITDQAFRHPSPLQCSGLLPALDGHPGGHPTHDGAKTCPQFPSNPDPASPYSNYFMLFVSFQPCNYSSCTHPCFLHSHIPIPPKSWL